MGQLDQLAKLTFAEETEELTGGAVTFQLVPEIGLTDVRGDGLFLVRDPERLGPLAWPWPSAREHREVLVDFKMQGDHLDIRAIQRALLRRQALQVQRVEEADPPWLGEQSLWLIAPWVPGVLAQVRTLVEEAPGCYRVSPASFSFLWIAANELPLAEELIPFSHRADGAGSCGVRPLGHGQAPSPLAPSHGRNCAHAADASEGR